MYVCLIVGHVREPCKDEWTDRNADWRVDVDSGWPKEPRAVLDRGPGTQGEEVILGVVRPTEKRKAPWVTAAVYAAKSQYDGIAADSLLQTGQCRINVSPVKNPPPAMRPVVKILRPLATPASRWRWVKAEAAIVINFSTGCAVHATIHYLWPHLYCRRTSCMDAMEQSAWLTAPTVIIGTIQKNFENSFI